MTAGRIVMTAGISVAVAVFTVLWFSSKKKKKPSIPPNGSDKRRNSVAKEEFPPTQGSSSEEQLGFRHTDIEVEEISANTYSAKDSSVTTASSERSLAMKTETPLLHVEPCKSPEPLNLATDKFEQEECEDAPLQNEQNEMTAVSSTKSPAVQMSVKSLEEETSSTEEQAFSKEQNATFAKDISGETTTKEDDVSGTLGFCSECTKNADDESVATQVLSPPLSSAVTALSSDSNNVNCSSEHKVKVTSSDALPESRANSTEAEEVKPQSEPPQESSSTKLDSPSTQEADKVQASSQRSSVASLLSTEAGTRVNNDVSAEIKTGSAVGKDYNCDACEAVPDRIDYVPDTVDPATGSSSCSEVQTVPTSDWGTAVEELERRNKLSPKASGLPSGQLDSHKSPSPTPVDTPLVSPGSEVSSEVSNDSGRGTMDNGAASTASSTNHQDQASVLEEEQTITWNFNFPSDLCGRLIGKQGRNIKFMMDMTGCRILVRKRQNIRSPWQCCTLIGTQTEVDHALDLIGERFPDVDLSAVEDHPNSDSSDISQIIGEHMRYELAIHPYFPGKRQNGERITPVLPTQLQLQLTEGINDVVVCSITDAAHVFVQQHVHPTFPALATLDHCMAICYADQTGVPGVPKPVDVGVICVAPSPMVGAYCRAEVRDVMEETDSVVVKFCDYGGYYHVPRDVLKQIRSDFMTLPFQAVECYLANIAPLEGEETFSLEATGLVEELTQGMVTQVNVVGYSDGCPLVHLYSTQADTSVMVNRVMVEQGLAQWIEG